MFEIVHAHHSTEATPLNVVRPEVPAELAAVVRKMMAKDAAQRYQTPMEVVRALDPFVKGTLKPLPPQATLPPASQRLQRESFALDETPRSHRHERPRHEVRLVSAWHIPDGQSAQRGEEER